MREVLLNDLTLGIHLRDSKDFGVSDTIANADSMSSSTPKFTKSPTSNTANLNHTQNPQETQTNAQDSKILQDLQAAQETTSSGRICEEKSLLSNEQARSYLSGSAAACESRINDFNRKANAKAKTSQEQTPKQVTLHSKYGNIKAIFETTLQSVMLPFTKGGEYFVFDNMRFYVIQGEGALYYLDCVKAYDFENLEAECLEQFLLTGKQIRDYKQRELIKDFLTIDTKNIQKGKMYLLPKNYEALQIRIIGGCL